MERPKAVRSDQDDQRGGVGSAGFWIFDDDPVALEAPTASIQVARQLIVTALDDLTTRGSIRTPPIEPPDAATADSFPSRGHLEHPMRQDNSAATAHSMSLSAVIP